MGNPRFTLIRADICDGPAVAKALARIQPDVIMHLAAESHVDRAIDGPHQFIETNVIGTYVLLQSALYYWRGLTKARQGAFRFHHVSTDEVFGSLASEGRFSEESPYRPNSPYSASKAASDHLARAWRHTYGLPVVMSNCSNNYGPCQFPEKLVPLTILNALEGKWTRRQMAMGSNRPGSAFAEDHARALLVIAQRGRLGETIMSAGLPSDGTSMSSDRYVRCLTYLTGRARRTIVWLSSLPIVLQAPPALRGRCYKTFK